MDPVTLSISAADADIIVGDRYWGPQRHAQLVGRLADAIVESRTHDDNHNITASARSTYATYDHDHDYACPSYHDTTPACTCHSTDNFHAAACPCYVAYASRRARGNG